ncbi:MAG: flagellar assembly protein A, partial [Actinomycetota bacterium]
MEAQAQDHAAAPAPAAQGVDGTVAVVGGALVVTDPDDGGRPADVVAGDGIRLTVDGRVVPAAAVTRDTRVEIDAGARDPVTLVEARVTGDCLRAELVVTRTPGAVCGVADHPPARTVTLTRVDAVTLDADPATPDRARAALAAAGVVHGLDEDALAAALAAPGGSAVVAHATRATPPVDAAVTIPVEAQLSDPLHTVRAGTLLARKTPAVPGRDGTTVLGTPIPAPAPKDPVLDAGPGARLDARDDG